MSVATDLRGASVPMVCSGAEQLRDKRVIVVEDQALIAMDLQATLEDHGAKVLGPFARLAEAAQATKRKEPIDAAILDVDLRGELIFPLADRLLAMGVPLVFHTGRADTDVLRMRYGEVVVLVKPALSEAVVHGLVGALAAARP